MTLTEQRRTQVITLWEQGLDVDDIATRIGAPTTRVQVIVDTYDVPHDLPERPAQEMAKGGHVRSQAAAGGDPDFTARLAGKGPRRRAPQPYRRGAGVLAREERWPHQHGTTSGYKRHLKEKTQPCDDCTQANRDKQRQDRRAAGIWPKPLQPCGTWAAYQRHIADKTLVDPECREAARLRSEIRRKSRTQP